LIVVVAVRNAEHQAGLVVPACQRAFVADGEALVQLHVLGGGQAQIGHGPGQRQRCVVQACHGRYAAALPGYHLLVDGRTATPLTASALVGLLGAEDEFFAARVVDVDHMIFAELCRRRVRRR
jgi:hypothetical protein